MLTRSLSHGKKSLPIPIVLVTLIGWNLSGDIYFISSLRGHSKYPASQLEEIPVDRFSLWRMKRKKIKVREVLYPANLMGLIVQLPAGYICTKTAGKICKFALTDSLKQVFKNVSKIKFYLPSLRLSIIGPGVP